MTKTNEQIIVSSDETIINNMMGLSDTSKKIRYLLSEGKTVAQIYNIFKGRVTTKEGGEIRYQHVRNVAMTKLSDKK